MKSHLLNVPHKGSVLIYGRDSLMFWDQLFGCYLHLICIAHLKFGRMCCLKVFFVTMAEMFKDEIARGTFYNVFVKFENLIFTFFKDFAIYW